MALRHACLAFLLVGCSFVRSSDDFTFGGDAGVDGDAMTDAPPASCVMDMDCPMRPNAAARCVEGDCRYDCASGFADCDGTELTGCEIDTNTDLGNCGGCGMDCAEVNGSASCDMGTCTLSCDDGFEDCDGMGDTGCEADLATDPMSCGACGNVCADPLVCSGGLCDPVVEVAVGGVHTCHLRESGRVVCLGGNGLGVLGNGLVLTPNRPITAVELDSADGGGELLATTIASGTTHACALDLAGLPWCWGGGDRGQIGNGAFENENRPTAVIPQGSMTFPERFTTLESSGQHTCAIGSDASLWCWGDNVSSQINDAAARRPRAVRILFAASPTIVDVATGRAHTCAVDDGGTLWCWGDDDQGQLGDGRANLVDTDTPTQVSALSDVRSIDAGADHNCAITNDDRLFCWGGNLGGQVGFESFLGLGVPDPTEVVLGSPVRAVALGDWHTCALTDDGVRCWGRGLEGQLGQGLFDPEANGAPIEAVGLPASLTAIEANRTQSCVLTDDGRPWCWGENRFEQLGTDLRLVREGPSPVRNEDGSEPTFDRVSAGGVHSCGVSGGSAFCWGEGDGFALGTGQRRPLGQPQLLGGLTNVTQVSAGLEHACAISDGSLLCWGRNDFQQAIGTAVGAPVEAPTTVDLGAPVDSVAAGVAHTCAIADGDVHCWGATFAGRLGRDTGVALWADPGIVTGLPGAPVELALGDAHSCARLEDGRVACWGGNGSGQLGVTGPDTRVPQIVERVGGTPLANVGLVASGFAHSCAITDLDDDGGTVWCWGAGTSGQLGNLGTAPSDSSSPVQPAVGGTDPITDAVGLALGAAHSCAVRDDGTVFCWGTNQRFELGDGTTMQRNLPSQVPMLERALSISGGLLHTIAVLEDGTARCWGYNESGRCGTGESVFISVPTQVGVLP